MRRQIIPQLFCWLVVLAGVADVVVGVGSSAMADQQSDSPQEQVRQAAEEYGCDPALLWAIQRSECDFENPKDCMSSVGAMGPFQFMPGTLEMLGESQADVWSYYGSGVVACEFVLFLGLQEQKSSSGTRMCPKLRKCTGIGSTIKLLVFNRQFFCGRMPVCSINFPM